MISPSDRRNTIDLIERALSSGARLSPACDAIDISPRTYQRWSKNKDLADGRQSSNRTPSNRLSQEERDEILALCNQPQHSHLPPSQIVPKLADEGRYVASESTFYRVLKQAGQTAHRGRAKSQRKVTPPMSHKAVAPNQVWSWDITFLRSCVAGYFFRLYLIMDIFSRKIVGWEIHDNESSDHASTLITKACLAEGLQREQLVLHSDNGSPMKGLTMLTTLQRLGIIPSFSRPSVSDDNPYSESLFRTLKYTPAYPSKPFESIDHAREWVLKFVTWYNNEHRHSGLNFVTPTQKHQRADVAILQQRKILYEEAKMRHPSRWSKSTRHWAPIEEVWLNPTKEEKQSLILKQTA
jgi:transposase InsO family protein